MDEKTPTAEFKHTFENDRVTAKIHLYKVDKETGKPYPQGDASLEGAVYGLYARNDIVHPDGKTGVLYKKGTKVAELKTDATAEAEIKNLYLGDYYIKEIEAPVGYNIDTEEHDLKCDYEGDLVAEVARESTSEEQVKKQPFQLIKVSDNGEDTEAPLLEGAGFTAYLKSKLLVKEDGSQAQLNEKLQFKVIEFNKESKRIILSHSRIYEDAQRAEAREAKKATKRTAPRKEEAPAIQNQAASTTLGDLDALAALKAKMQAGE
jgi:uncharacterized surface anchored protein